MRGRKSACGRPDWHPGRTRYAGTRWVTERIYGVQSTPNLATVVWPRLQFSTGTNSILATNELVEATCTVPVADTNRFFRVLEAN